MLLFGPWLVCVASVRCQARLTSGPGDRASGASLGVVFKRKAEAGQEPLVCWAQAAGLLPSGPR